MFNLDLGLKKLWPLSVDLSLGSLTLAKMLKVSPPLSTQLQLFFLYQRR